MSLQIHPATHLDAPALTAVFLAAFDDDFNHALFPRTADVREWWTVKFTHEVSQPGQVVLKVVDASSASCASDHGEIVAFAIWKLPSTTTDLSGCTNQEDEDEDEDSWPASSDASLCSRFFGQMAKKRKMYMGSRPHYCVLNRTDLDILGTHPTHHGRGIASQLLKWGLERADRDGLEVFLSASPAGRPIYEKKGFRVVEMEEVARGYVQAYMLRGQGSGGGV